MKPAEKVLREWTMNRIRFHGGEARYQHFTQDGIKKIVEHIQTGVRPQQIQVARADGTWCDYPYASVLRSLRVKEINLFLTKLGGMGRVSPLWLARFESLKELHALVTHEAIVAGHTLEYWEVWGAQGPPSKRMRRALKL